MKDLSTRELETERPKLRRFRLSDSEAMFNNWANDPQVTKYLSWETHSHIGVTEDRLTIKNRGGEYDIRKSEKKKEVEN